MKKKLAIGVTAASLALTLSLSACSSATQSSSSSSASASTTTESAAVQKQLDELYAAAKASGKTTVNVYALDSDEYSDPDQTGVGKVLEKFKAAYPDITIKTLDIPDSSSILDRVDAERTSGNYQADVAIYGDTELRTLREQGDLQKFTPAGAANLANDSYKDDKGYLYSPYYQFHSLNFNSSKISRDQLPKTLAELADPKWKGKFAIGPAQGQEPVAKGFATLILNNQLDAATAKKALANAVVESSIGTTIQGVLQGKYEFSILTPGSVFLGAKQQGATVDTADIDIKLQDVEWTGVFAHAPHPDAAKLFTAWWYSNAAQKALPTDSFFFSTQKDAQANVNWPTLTAYTRKRLSIETGAAYITSHLAEIKSLFPATKS